MTTVLICDDEALMRAGLALILGAQPDLTVVGQATDGLQAVAMGRRLRPDVVLMDIRMPGLDGVAATRQLTAAGHPVKVLVLTTFDLDEHVYRALRAGASGFLLKGCPPDVLVHGVRVVASGEALLAPSVTRRLLDTFVPRLATDDADGVALRRLTDRETQVLRLVAHGLSNAEIATELNVTTDTVKTHLSRVLAKLGVRDRVQAVVLAYRSGLMATGPDPTSPAAGPWDPSL